MISKSFDYKLKWLMIGLLSGIFCTVFLSESFSSNRLNNEQNIDLLHGTSEHKFAEYSQWPPFLSDPTFDLVKIIFFLIKSFV